MLFDLQGRRRRLVQVVYLTLALLMGGGLVFFGIGGDVSGGLFDAFSENRSGGGGSNLEDRIEDAEKAVEENPRDRRALERLILARYQLANEDAENGQYTDRGIELLNEASDAWRRYLEVAERPKLSLANTMLQAYTAFVTEHPEAAVRAAEIVTEARPSAQGFLALTQFATQAGNTRLADLAGRRAIELAEPGERDVVEARVEEAKQATPAPEPAGGG